MALRLLNTTPTELVSVVNGPLHYAVIFVCRVVHKPKSTETSSVGLMSMVFPRASSGAKARHKLTRKTAS